MPDSPTAKNALTRGYLIALISAAILSTTAIFIRHLTVTYGLPALVLALWRDVFVVATLLVALGLLRPALLRAGRSHLPFLVGYGVVLAVFNALWTLSVAQNGAAIATVLVYSSPAFTALLSCWLLKERLDWAKILVIVTSFAGCVLVSGALDAAAWTANPAGILTGLLSGLGYAGYTLMGRKASQRGLNPWTTLIYTFGFASVVLLAVNLIPGAPLPGSASRPADIFWLDGEWAGWLVLFVLAAVPTVMGFGLYNVSLTLLPSTVVNLIATLEPPFTAVIAYLLLRERLDGVQVVGSLIILGSVALLRIYEGWMAGRRPVKQSHPVLP
ncbi:MAG: DMT family transporter [Anaerolineae bacterium]|nr:DMT family transporter [Anaerolineae bacterium]